MKEIFERELWVNSLDKSYLGGQKKFNRNNKNMLLINSKEIKITTDLVKSIRIITALEVVNKF